MLKVLIAVDGSEHAQHAIDAVAALARNGCQIHSVLLNVRDTPVVYGEVPMMSWEGIEEAQKAVQNEVLAAAEGQARKLGLVLGETRRAVGFASDEIVRAARELAVDQIVMGTRGRGAVRTLFMGSVAQRVVHDSPVPVLLTR